jgi:hypothetical protein
MLADGGECITDITTLADLTAVFSPVASALLPWTPGRSPIPKRQPSPL